MSEKEFIPTVTITLKEYDNLRLEAAEHTKRVERINEALKGLYKFEIEDLIRNYENMRDTDSVAQYRIQLLASGRITGGL